MPALQQPGVCAQNIDQILVSSFKQSTASHRRDSAHATRLNLATYWRGKRRLQQSLAHLKGRMFNISWTYMLHAALRLPSAKRNLTALLQVWRAAAAHQRYTRQLNKQIRQQKQADIEHLITQANTADARGLTHVYKLIHQLRPKTP